MATFLRITRIEHTREATAAYLHDVLDPMIDEVQDQLELLLGQRRALAITMQVDRPREDASNVTKMIAAASRSHYEGDAGDQRSSLARYAEADIVVTHSGKVLKSKFGPEDELKVLVLPDAEGGRLVPRLREGS